MTASRTRRLLQHLLAEAGLAVDVVSVEPLGIGSAGLNTRGNRDEDGTQARVTLDHGGTVLLREYATTGSSVQLGRGAAYARGPRTNRPGSLPPPHSTAQDALDELPATVQRLKTELAVRESLLQNEKG